MVGPFLPEAEKIRAVRDALPATSAGIYLNTGSIGPLPAETARTMREAEDRELRLGRATLDDWEDFLARMDEARGVVAALLAADPSAIALTHSTTDGMNIAVAAVDWQPGDRAVSTAEEHPGGLAPLVAARDRWGVELALVELAGRDDEAIVDAFDRAITPATRLVAVSHVAWATGVRLPVEAIGELARARGAWFVVDGAQSAGAIPIDVAATGADFFALSGQKWLLGPEGTGALWASPRAIAEAGQPRAGYLSYQALSLDARVTRWPDARRFEATTFHRPSVVGLGRTVGWLEMYVGLGWAHERAGRLARWMAERLADVPGVTVLTPLDRMATLVSFRIAGWASAQAQEELSRRAHAIVRTIPGLDAVRVSVAWFNTEEELARFLEVVTLIAGHTPDSIPRRPTLTILRADGSVS